VKLNHPAGGRHPEINVQVRQIRAKLRSIQCYQVVAFVFNLTVITPGKGAAIPNPWGELLTEVDVAKADVLRLQAT
jgi:hypothetical protein